MLNERSGKLKAQTVKVDDLTKRQVRRMFEVFAKYYDQTSFDVFIRDLSWKEAVFLLVDSGTEEIMGFATIQELETELGGETVRGLFTGDTVIEKAYWGQGALGVAFLKYLFLKKLKKPFSPLYWFLISKGYKTYLLMANNFKKHYPRYERETPEEKQEIIDAFAKQLYGSCYDPERGVISFEGKNECKDALKGEITPITQDMLAKNKRINFFAKQNPGWEKGEELACIAEMTLLMPLQYQLKTVKKSYSRTVERLPLPMPVRRILEIS